MSTDPSAYSGEVDRARRYYDAAASNYESLWAPFDESESAFRSRQAYAVATLLRGTGRASLSGLTILDVGCGRGRQLRGFLDLGAEPEELYGVDVHEPSLAVARRLSPHLRFTAFDGWQLPYPDESFDLVTQFVVFSSIALSDLRHRLASEMMRVLRPGGYILWWDLLHLAQNAGGAEEPLELGPLFPGAPRTELRLGRQPALSECVRVPRRLRRILGPVLRRISILDHPSTHIAALIGPR